MTVNRRLIPVDLQKVDGMKIRAPHLFNKATENLVVAVTKSNPNRGFPDFLMEAWEKVLLDNPDLIVKNLKLTARQQNVPVKELMDSLRRYKPEFFTRIEV